ncbi:glycosyltransferase, partial [Candidatus Woesearchaeota archaeon]|nr:glycosyltransferase [Candidatus Woesearchaeota archaeon]
LPKIINKLVKRFFVHYFNRNSALLVPKISTKKRFLDVETTFLELSKKLKLSGYPGIKILSLKNNRLIKKAVKAADVLFVQELGPTGVKAVHYAHKFKIPSVMYIHNTHWDFFAEYFSFLPKIINKLVKRFFVHYFNRNSALLVPYRNLENELKKAGVKAPIEVARLGVDIHRFSPVKDKTAIRKKLGLPLDKKIIGYVGRISREKNVQILIEAFKKLQTEEDVYLLLVGDGPQDQVQLGKKTKKCKMTGFVNNVEEYLQAMDIFVMPSLTETTSLATLEAMATGLPVVVTKVGFMQYYITKNYNGLFFPRNSATMLAIKIEKLLRDQELRGQLGEQARKTVAYSFSWDRSINKMKRLLKKYIHYNQNI